MTNGLTARIDKGVLVLTIPLTGPQPSKTGKTLVCASTKGNVKTEVQVQGKTLVVGLNAYIAAN